MKGYKCVFVLFQPTVFFVDSKSVNQRLRDFQCVSLRSSEKTDLKCRECGSFVQYTRSTQINLAQGTVTEIA